MSETSSKLVLNELGLSLLMELEGLKLEAYQDVAGVWTIGYGHTRGVYLGMRITKGEALLTLSEDVASACNAVAFATRSRVPNENQFAAMVLFCYNVGSANFRSSGVLGAFLAGDDNRAANTFFKWNHAHVDGILREVAGLTNRRIRERALFLAPVSRRPPSDPQMPPAAPGDVAPTAPAPDGLPPTA